MCCAPSGAGGSDPAQGHSQLQSPGQIPQETVTLQCTAKVFHPSGKAVAQRGQVRVFYPCLEAQHPFHPATLLPRAVSQRGVLNGDTVNASPPREQLCELADLTQRGAPLPMTPARASCVRPTSRPGELLREGLGRREDRKTGRGCRRSAILCKPAFQSLPLSQKPSLHSPTEMQLHSFSSALCQRRTGTGASCAREGFPTLLSPAFSAGVSS